LNDENGCKLVKLV